MKSLLLLGSLPFLFFNPQKPLNCSDFKTGTFSLSSANGNVHTIIRQQNIQTENIMATGFESRFDIKWLDNCTYLLFNRRVSRGIDQSPQFNQDTLVNEIISVEGNTCKVISTIKRLNFKVESVLKKIK